MAKFTARYEIVATKSIVASELARMQKACFDEEILQCYKDNNEEQLYWEQFDCLKNKVKGYRTFNKIISLGHSDVKSFAKKLTEKLTQLFNTIGATHLIIISDLKNDFFGNRDNKFKPLKQAYNKLEKIVGDKTFKEAFSVDIDDLKDFIEIIFWITRCDPSVPGLYLFDDGEQIQIRLCKYGNIHLIQYKKVVLTEGKLKDLGWTILKKKCFDNFTSTGRIEGRQLKV